MKFYKKARLRNYSRSKCSQGHYHHSNLEAGYCDTLALMVKSGDILEYEIQKVFEFRINDVLICRHKPDFYVKTVDGTWEVHEVKGHETDLWKLKYRLFQGLYPDIKYHIVK